MTATLSESKRTRHIIARFVHVVASTGLATDLALPFPFDFFR